MQPGTDFIRALEHHRALTLARRTPQPEQLSDQVVMSWIHHDNMIEGQLFKPAEISAALAEDDESVDRYLVPLMRAIRRYRDVIRFVWSRAHEGTDALTLDNLKTIHRMQTPDPRDRGGLYRRTSPVHRAYYQKICAAEKVPYQLRKLFEDLRASFGEAKDPVAVAADFHRRLMHIYPFRRNPGTTVRLFTNLLLLSLGYPPAIIPAHGRAAYYNALCRPDSVALADIFRQSIAVFLEGHGGLEIVKPAA